MRRILLGLWLVTLSIASACGAYAADRVDSTALRQSGDGPALGITILGDSTDPRLAPAREALAHWNDEFRRLGRRVQLSPVVVRPNLVPDDVVRAAGGEAVAPPTAPISSRLRRRTRSGFASGGRDSPPPPA